ncbi:OmpA family protein [Bernardetia sp. Wsw4-3y2]|uniref:OmpA family protein n=1 Tax=Bernardetia sp. Wsw4-3y2 TaxID=3127471 RepID=UPI0030D4ECB2
MKNIAINKKMPKKINLTLLVLISLFSIQSHLLVAQRFSKYASLNSSYVHSAIIDEDNSRWLATEGGIYMANMHINWIGYCNPRIATYLVVEAPDDKVWFITHRNDIITLGKKEDKSKYRPFAEKNIQEFNFRFLKDVKVSNLVFPKDSRTFWVASKGDGLWKKVDQDFIKVKLQKKNSPEDINDIILFEGKLWVATTEGFYSTEDILTTNKKHSFVQVSNFSNVSKMIIYQNQLWVLGLDTNNKGILKSTKNGKDWTPYPTPKFFEYQVPNLMAFDSENKLWVASDRVAKFDVFGDKSWTEYREREGFVGKNALSLAIEKKCNYDRIWLATDVGGIYFLRNNTECKRENNKETETVIDSKQTEKVEVKKIKKVESLSTLLKRESTEDIKGKQIQLKIQFDITKSNILPQYEDELNEIVDYMKKNKDLFVLIQGHTAPIGDAQKNQELSEKRANEVKNYLSKAGINVDRIKTYGYGDTQPLTTDTKLMSENMRVEIMFYDVK